MTQRTILITGCSSGIGLASARLMHARGWHVLATARRDEDLARLAAEGLTPVRLELADADSVARCAAAALEAGGGRVDALFNNAAYGQPGAVEDIRADVLRHQFEVNVVGTHELTRLLLPAMRRAGSGRIVNCSSVLGLVAAPWRGAYCASKFALEGLSDALRLELAGSGVHVALIEPGPIRTRFIETAMAAARAHVDITGSVHAETYRRLIAGMERGGKQFFKLEPEAVAAKLIHAVESRRPKTRYYVTTPTYVAAYLKRLLPDRLMDLLAARG